MSRQSWAALAVCVVLVSCARSEAPQGVEVGKKGTRLESDAYGWVPVPWILADRSLAAMATLNGKAYLFGGEARNDLWAWDGARWERVDTPVRPPARVGHAMATLGSKIVLFGGWAYPGWEHLDDTWEFDGQRWQEKRPALKPPARVQHGMTAFQGKVVMHGGLLADLSAVSDTWTWDGSEWAELKPEHSPEGCLGPTFLASDGERVVYSNSWWASELGTWFWDGSDWSRSAGPAPQGAAMALEGSLYIVGGLKTWKWSGSAWSELGATPEGLPVAIASLNGKLVKYGGASGDPYAPKISTATWSFDGSAWSQAAKSDSPPARSGHASATAADGTVIIFGGSTGPTHDDDLDDTWRWDGVRWQQLESVHRPRPAGAIWDGVLPMAAYGSKMALLLPAIDGREAEMWEWDGLDWTQQFPEHLPRVCSGSMASLGDRIVLKDGAEYGASSSTTWEWDGSDWTAKSSKTVPGWITAFEGKAVAYSPGRFFEWDGAAWNSQATVGGPEYQGEIAALGGHLLGDLGKWEWDGSSWRENPYVGEAEKVQIAGFGPADGVQVSGISKQGETLVLFGGYTGVGWESRTFLYQRLLAPGSTCAIDEECLGGNCIDGVCCDTACRGRCESCAEPGLVGTCTPHAGTPLNGRALCGDGSPCEGTCDGIQRDACVLQAAAGTVCGRATRCVMGIAWLSSACDGAGSCRAHEPQSIDCAPYGCDGEVCATSCAADTDCVSGYRCEAGRCIERLEVGEACAKGSLCQRGFCVHGVCCESRCPGQCEACDVPGQLGKCLPIDGPPREDRAVCPGGGQCVAGACEAVAAEPDGCGCGSVPRGGAGGWSAVLLGLAVLSAGARKTRSR